ncbi:MAG TPA: hypothetical protein VF746_03855 [Longimicrobium sp.]|jgi:hypothetical protein
MPLSDQEKHVFINCPFDNKHTPLFRAMIFAVHDCGFIARCALESEDAGEVRIKKIIQIIRESRYGIHDISRIELDRSTRFPRFNMPLELGIFLGAKEFGSREQRRKACLILDRERYRYQVFCSDIAGQDIREHGNHPDEAIRAVRNFLANQRPNLLLPSAGTLSQRYSLFKKQLPRVAREHHLDTRELSFNELRNLVLAFLQENPW